MSLDISKPSYIEKYPKNVFFPMFNVYKISGLYHPEKQESWYAKILWWTLNISTIVTLFVLYSPAEIAMISYTSTDLNMLVEHVGMIMTHIGGLYKYATIFFNYKILKKIVDILDRDEFKYENCGDFKPAEIMTQGKKYCKYLCWSLFWAGTLVPLMKQYDSVLKFTNEEHLISEGNVSCQDMLPYYSWFPFNVETTRMCKLGFILQSFPMIWYVYPVISGDSAFISYAIVFCAHFIVLRGAALTVTERCLARLGLPNNYQILHAEENPALQREIKLEMKRITIHLQTLIELCNTCEEVLNKMILFQTMISMFMIVSSLYMLTEVEFMSPVFIADAEFVAAGLFEIFVYAAFGNEVTITSTAILDGIYESNWLFFTQGDKRTMLINMRRLQVPIKFTTGKFATLSLATFISIVKGSYSYFTVLKQSK